MSTGFTLLVLMKAKLINTNRRRETPGQAIGLNP
jgi:hypothetical protein